MFILMIVSCVSHKSFTIYVKAF